MEFLLYQQLIDIELKYLMRHLLMPMLLQVEVVGIMIVLHTQSFLEQDQHQ